jgi:hypothetical protein
MTQPKSERMELSIEALEAILEQARSTPLSEAQIDQLKGVLNTLGRLTRELEKKRTSIARLRNLLFGPQSEKTADVLKKKRQQANDASKADAGGKGKKKNRKGHGRNGAEAYKGAKRIEVSHESLKPGDPCPETGCTGKVYKLPDPGMIVRIKGLPPLSATLYELEKLRCNLCGTVCTAQAPEGIGEKKYDETAVSMIACLKYGAGFPFNRLEKLEANLGIALPAATQWDLVKDPCEVFEPVFDALIGEAAQGEVLHNDDTPMKILELMAENHRPEESSEEPSKRTGLFTSGVIAKRGEHLMALFFTGRNHAGENLQAVLERRSKALPLPIHMCDALSRNLPKEFETLLANCLGHGRRRFVDVVESFPEDVRYVLEILAKVYKNDALARQDNLSPQQRLSFHQEESGPLMQELHKWFERQFEEKRVEPNSSLGEAITYMLNHWQALTLFLREPGAPLDNNICERALKKAILHRKNSLFYKTQNGARVGDIYMTLIHTAELAGANAFDYLCELQRHAGEVKANPRQWMPWNYRETLRRIAAEGNRQPPERSPPD